MYDLLRVDIIDIRILEMWWRYNEDMMISILLEWKKIRWVIINDIDIVGIDFKVVEYEKRYVLKRSSE